MRNLALKLGICVVLCAQPSASQPGSRILFLSDRDGELASYLMMADGSNALSITRQQWDQFWRVADPYNQYQETPQGTRILDNTKTEIGFLDDIVITDKDGNIVQKLTDDDYNNQFPKRSPDRTKILFSSNLDRERGFDVFVMDNDGSNLVKVSGDDGGGMEQWSADGARIVFSKVLSDQPPQLFTVDPDGDNLVQLTSVDGAAQLPKWSPDGSRIAFSYTEGEGSEIYVINKDGTDLLNLTNHSADELRFDWSPDGQKIVFDSDRDGNREIYVVGRNGDDLTRLTNNLAQDLAPTWGPDEAVVQTILNSPTAINVTNGALPAKLALDQNYPNPFNSETVIRFELPSTQEAELSIYGLTGQQVAMLSLGMREAGSHTVRWDGRDPDGRNLASGVYFIRLESGLQIQVRKLLLLR